MKLIMNLLLITIFLATLSCRKSNEEFGLTPTPTPASNDPLVWSYSSEIKGLGSNNHIYKNTIIQGARDENYKFHVIALTLDSGKLAWQAGPFNMHIPIGYSSSLLSDYHLCFLRRNKLLVLHAETGDVIWDITLPKPITNGMTEKDKKLYISTSFENGVSDIYKFDLYSGDLATVVEVTSEQMGGLDPYLSAPSYWKHPNGDEILVFGSRGQYSTNLSRGDKFAYNMTADTLLWYVRGADKTSVSTAYPHIHNNSAIFYGLRHVERINLLDGSVIWTHARHASDAFSAYRTANIVVQDNIVIAKPDYFYTYGIDIETGEELWHLSNSAASPYAIRVGLGKLWFGANGINCIDIKSGRQLLLRWRYRHSSSWINPIAIDEETGYIYTIVSGIIYCFDSKVLISQ